MNKTQAIEHFGEEVVNKAREMYETNFGKVLFAEDCVYEDDCPAGGDIPIHYCARASVDLYHQELQRTGT